MTHQSPPAVFVSLTLFGLAVASEPLQASLFLPAGSTSYVPSAAPAGVPAGTTWQRTGQNLTLSTSRTQTRGRTTNDTTTDGNAVTNTGNQNRNAPEHNFSYGAGGAGGALSGNAGAAGGYGYAGLYNSDAAVVVTGVEYRVRLTGDRSDVGMNPLRMDSWFADGARDWNDDGTIDANDNWATYSAAQIAAGNPGPWNNNYSPYPGVTDYNTDGDNNPATNPTISEPYPFGDETIYWGDAGIDLSQTGIQSSPAGVLTNGGTTYWGSGNISNDAQTGNGNLAIGAGGATLGNEIDSPYTLTGGTPNLHIALTAPVDANGDGFIDLNDPLEGFTPGTGTSGGTGTWTTPTFNGSGTGNQTSNADSTWADSDGDLVEGHEDFHWQLIHEGDYTTAGLTGGNTGNWTFRDVRWANFLAASDPDGDGVYEVGLDQPAGPRWQWLRNPTGSTNNDGVSSWQLVNYDDRLRNFIRYTSEIELSYTYDIYRLAPEPSRAMLLGVALGSVLMVRRRPRS